MLFSMCTQLNNRVSVISSRNKSLFNNCILFLVVCEVFGQVCFLYSSILESKISFPLLMLCLKESIESDWTASGES